MKIKDVSEKFQLSPDTLRYYEKIVKIDLSKEEKYVIIKARRDYFEKKRCQ